MTALENRIETILSDELAEARASSGALGYVGVDIPADLLLASGRFICHLPWRADRDTPVADRWLEDSFAPWARSMLEDWASGRFDCLESVIFSRGNDSAQRLYYYVCELKRLRHIDGPTPLIFDVAKIERKSSVERTVNSVRRLADQLDIGDLRLKAGIDAANRRRALFARVQKQRSGPGSLYERIARATLFAALDEELESHKPGPIDEAPKILLAGSAPPDDRLHLAVEAAGCVVCAESYERGLQRLGPLNIADPDDPAAAIGKHAHRLCTGSRSFVDRAAQVVETARNAGADGVIVWLTEDDEAPTWTIPSQRSALDAAGIPALIATGRRWDASDGIVEDIAAFLLGIES